MCTTTTLVPIPDLLADVRESVDPAHPEYGHLDDETPCFAIDSCIVETVKALWAAGVRTLGCCCGHGSGHAVVSFEPPAAEENTPPPARRGFGLVRGGGAKMSAGASLVTIARMSPEVSPMPPHSTCSIPDCNNHQRLRRGWCPKHYRRWLAHGDPLITLTPTRVTGADAERFAAKTGRADEDGCKLWTVGLNHDGYGQFRADGTMVLAHRWAYEREIGPIPDGLTLDHLCRNRACVEVTHLEPVTNRVNILREIAPAAWNARKTHCKRGHEFTPENTYMRKQGNRACRQCQRARPARAERK